MKINLLPWREEVVAFNKAIFIRLMLSALILSVIALLLGYQLYFSQVSHSQSYLKALEEAKTNLGKKVSLFFNQKKMQEEVNKRITVLERLQQSRYETVRLLNQIIKVTPKGIYLLKMERKDKQVEILGMTNSNLLITQLMKDINLSPELEIVSLQKVEKSEGKNLVVTQFDLILTLTMDGHRVKKEATKPQDEINNPATEILKMRENQEKKIENIVNEGKKP